MEAIEAARKLAALNQRADACDAYTLALHSSAGAEPAVELEAALYILQFGSGESYKISYTVLRGLYNKGFCKEDILRLMDGAFYTPNVKQLQSRYRKNCALLGKYPYIFRKDFPKFEDLPIRFYPYGGSSYTPYYPQEERFGDYIDFKKAVIEHNFFKDLEKPVLAENIYSQYELEYLRDNVRRSEDVARENHVYLYYGSWTEFCAYLTCLNLRPLLEEKKLVFLFEDEREQYPIDFEARFHIDYSKYTVKPPAIREVNRLIWHAQLSTHNGGDLFNEVFDAHPNLLAIPSIMMTNILETIQGTRKILEETGSLAEVQRLLSHWEAPRLVAELYHNRARTDKDILVGMYMYRKEYNGFVDWNARIAPALFFQPHFSNIYYSVEADDKDRAVLYSEEYETLRTCPALMGFKYIKTFVPLRRPTTSHGATVRFMDMMAGLDNSGRGEPNTISVTSDTVSERVLNRGFMADSQDRLQRDCTIVRFEDGKLNPRATFTALAAFLDLPYTQSMTSCTERGKPLQLEVRGFDPVTVYRTYDDFVNDSERIYIEYFLRDAYQYYGYDFHYYDGKPVSREQVEALLDGFTTLDSYIRKHWKLVFDRANISQNGVTLGDEQLVDAIRVQALEDFMENVHNNRRNITDILMKNLQFVSKNGQPLRFMPLLKPDPALLEQPLYH